MELVEAIRILKNNESYLRQIGVRSLYVFGSTARGEQHEKSDVDLFFDYDKDTLSLFHVMDIKERTSQLLGCHADIMTRSSVSRHIRKQVESEAVLVFDDNAQTYGCESLDVTIGRQDLPALERVCIAELDSTDQPPPARA